MKLSISEMMNELLEESVELEEGAVVSAEAVEQAVLQKLHGRTPHPRSRKLLLRTVLVAAVMTVLLSVAVLAGNDLQKVWDSPELQAAVEWYAYVGAKSMEYQEGRFPEEGPEAYGTYDWFRCFSQEMVEEMKAMAQRYGLTLPGMWNRRYDTIGTLYRELGASEFLPKQRGRAAYTWHLDDGSFDVMCEHGVLSNGDTAQYWLYCLRQGSFHPIHMALVGDLEDYELTEYTTADGTDVLLYLGTSDCLAVTELHHCIVVVRLCVGSTPNHRGVTVDTEALQAFADDIGFQIMDELLKP